MVLQSSRRDALLASLAALLPLGLADATASPIDPAQTIIKLPGELAWRSNPANPARSVRREMCVGLVASEPKPASKSAIAAAPGSGREC